MLLDRFPGPLASPCLLFEHIHVSPGAQVGLADLEPSHQCLGLGVAGGNVLPVNQHHLELHVVPEPLVVSERASEPSEHPSVQGAWVSRASSQRLTVTVAVETGWVQGGLAPQQNRARVRWEGDAAAAAAAVGRYARARVFVFVRGEGACTLTRSQ